MNRVTALLLAMAALLAHALAIHKDAADFAAPFEVAHVAYRLARNLVHSGELTWLLSPAEGGFSSYPSVVLVLVAAVAERLYLPVTLFAQMAGFLAILFTLGLSARFATDRLAGVVPPILLVASGGVATAAVSGTEIPLVALFLTASFVSFEHLWRKRFAVALVLLVLSRPEGIVMAAAFLGLGLLERIVPRRDGSASTPFWTYVPATLVALGLVFLPSVSESAYGASLVDLFAGSGERYHSGLLYFGDFFIASATPLLLVFPVVLLFFGGLSGAGVRALALTLLWATLVVLEGGGPLPFNLAMVPVLPVLFIATLQGLVAALDSKRTTLVFASWTAVVAALALSALASKYPGDLGPIKAEQLHREWMTHRGPTPYGRRPALGRLGLDDEIRITRELRDLGNFLRRNVDPANTLLTPWPGALGYLSGLQVLDLLGRTTAPPGMERKPYWPPRPSVDVLTMLAQEPDFILPGLITSDAVSHPQIAARITRELMTLDSSQTRQRVEMVEAELSNYEMIALPVPFTRDSRGTRGVRPFYLLRRRALGLAPELAITVDRDRIAVDVLASAGEDRPRGHAQLAQLWVQVALDDGGVRSYRPTGELSLDRACARNGLLLTPGGDRPVRLFEAQLPEAGDGALPVEVRAWLQNPGTRGDHPLATVSERVVVRL